MYTGKLYAAPPHVDAALRAARLVGWMELG
jgi:hypothetical protein